MGIPTSINRFLVPPVTLIGCGAVQAAGEQMKAIGGKKTLIVTDKFLATNGLADRIKKILEDAGGQAIIYGGAEPNPTDKNVADGLQAYRDNGCDSIITLGEGARTTAARRSASSPPTAGPSTTTRESTRFRSRCRRSSPSTPPPAPAAK